MKAIKVIYLKIFMLVMFFLVNDQAFANATKLKRWGGNVVQQGQTMGLSWMTGALVVCGFLSLIGIQFAQGMLARIIMGSGLVFGAGAISGLLKGIFG